MKENIKQVEEQMCCSREKTFLEGLEDSLDMQLKQVEKIRKAISYLKQNPYMEDTIKMFKSLYQ